MEILIALCTAAVALTFLLLVSFRWRWLMLPLMAAFLLRLAVSLIHRFVVALPQGSYDARVFERTAYDWSADGCLALLSHFNPSASYVYSAILSSFYGCMDRSVLGAQLLNVLVGLSSIVVVSLTAKRLWGLSPAKKVAWVMAFFPALIIYSSVTLREVFVFIFFSLGIYFVVVAAQKTHAIYLAFSSLLFLCASMFHSGTIFAVPASIVAYLLFANEPGSRKSLYRRRLFNVLIMVFFVCSALFLMDHIFLPKIGLLSELDADGIGEVVSNRADGGSAYLVGLTVNNYLDILWQAPIRMLYFLFSPLPWQIRSPGHAFGMIDSVAYLYLSFLLYRNRSLLVDRPDLKVLLFVFMALLFVFAFGTSNFGTAMRHRAKFGFLLVILAAPWLPSIKSSISRFRLSR